MRDVILSADFFCNLVIHNQASPCRGMAIRVAFPDRSIEAQKRTGQILIRSLSRNPRQALEHEEETPNHLLPTIEAGKKSHSIEYL